MTPKGRPLPSPRDWSAFRAYWFGGEAVQDGIDLVTFWVLRLLPIDTGSDFGAAMARRLGAGKYLEASDQAAANLRRLRPDMDEAQVQAAVVRRWEAIGRLMAEYAALDRIHRDGRVTVEGREHLTGAYAQGCGVVLIVLHIGNWELLPRVVRESGVDAATFYEPRPTRAHDHITRVTREKQVALLPADLAGVRPALRALEAKRLVAIFGDEGVDEIIRAPLFGRPPHAGGNLAYAVRFARRSGAPIVVAWVAREDGARFRTVFLPPVALPEAADPAGRLLDDIALLNSVIEPVVLAHLDQWWFLHDRLDPLG